MVNIEGCFTALVTPFQDDFSLDFNTYRRLIEIQVENKIGIVSCGCTGEAATLDHKEQLACIQFAVNCTNNRVPVIAGTGSNSTSEAIWLTRQAQALGADGALLITPYYNKPTPAGLIAHYSAVARAVPEFPIIIYNVPTRTGINMMPETGIEVARRNPNVIAIKECGGINHATEYVRDGRLTVLSGDDAAALPLISIGAKGLISVAANLVPALIGKLVILARSGNLVEARELNARLAPLIQGLFIETNPMPVKAALARQGMIKNILRLPLTSALPKTEETILAALKEIEAFAL